MFDFIVHTVRKEPGIHFFYRVKASTKDVAFSKLQRARALDLDEEHFETIPVPTEGDGYELIAIVKEQDREDHLFELR